MNMRKYCFCLNIPDLKLDIISYETRMLGFVYSTLAKYFI